MLKTRKNNNTKIQRKTQIKKNKNKETREQTIGKLGGGQSAEIVANAYSINVNSLYRL